MQLVLLTILLVGAPAAAYVTPARGNVPTQQMDTKMASHTPEQATPEDEIQGAFSIAAVSVGIGALMGWLSARRQQVASAATAAAVAVSPIAATAYVDYDGVQYLGGSDKVDINNANVQAYRQFPGMYPSAAGQICSHGPYKSVADVYNIPGLKEELKNIIKKYEGNFVVLPANPAYFIDRINNGLYR